VVRKLTYEERDFKGVTVNIYQKPQALINYLIDTFSREGDWVLDLFSGSGKLSDITCMRTYFKFYCFYIPYYFNLFKYEYLWHLT
jgi:DNA modification methylase